jgi:hypothetical protein
MITEAVPKIPSLVILPGDFEKRNIAAWVFRKKGRLMILTIWFSSGCLFRKASQALCDSLLIGTWRPGKCPRKITEK